MSADWKAGDKALCVKPFKGIGHNSGLPMPGELPKVGTIYLVVDVVQCSDGIPGLFLAYFDNAGYPCCSSKFRKIVPACDRATNSASITKWEP